jgi:hypothetical protein
MEEFSSRRKTISAHVAEAAWRYERERARAAGDNAHPCQQRLGQVQELPRRVDRPWGTGFSFWGWADGKDEGTLGRARGRARPQGNG